MTIEYAEAVAAWMAKARSDLATAKILILGVEPHYDTGTYHCQQAAEKSLKGWLTSRKLEFRKTHDLMELLTSCSEIHPGFLSIEPAAQFLIPFANQFRYPGNLFEPPPEEANIALESAVKIVHFVLSQLKDENQTISQN